MKALTRLAIGLAAATAALLPVPGNPRGASAETVAAPAHPTQMTIAAQDFNVHPGRNLQMSLELPPGQDAHQLSDSATVTVAIGFALTTRDQLADVLNGAFGEIEDVITLPIAVVPRTRSTLFIGVPTESGVKRRAELRLPERGIAPIRVQVNDGGKPVAELVSLVYRDPGDEVGPIQIGVAAGIRATPTIDAEGLPRLDETAIADVERLTDFLQTSDLPMLIDLEPSAVQAISRQRPDLYGELEASVSGHAVSSRPSLPLDPSGAADAGAGGLYRSWVTSGDAVTRSMLSATPDHSVYVMSAPLTATGAQLLADNGVRMMLTSAEIFAKLDNSPGLYFDPGKVVEATTSGTDVVDIKVPDGRIGAIIERNSADPRLSAIRVASELLMIRQMALADGSAGERAVVVATPDIGIPDPAVLTAFTALVRQTPAIEAVTFDELTANTTPMRVRGRPLTVGFNGDVGFDVARRISLASAYRSRSDDVASMLPAGDPHRQRWLQRLEQFPTSALSDTLVNQITSGLDAEYRAVLDAVIPPAPFTVTLGGLEATLHLRFQNTSTTPLKVRVRMTSGAGKLTFPTNDFVAELAPLAPTELEIPVVARSRGDFPIFVQVVTPAAANPIGSPVPLRARVNALSGIGNLITFTLLAVVLLWWWRSWRRKRATTLAGT